MYKRFFLFLLTFTLTIFITVACSNTDEKKGTENNEGEAPQTEEDSNLVDGDEEENEEELNEEQNDEENASSQSENDESDNDDLSSSEQTTSANKELPGPIVLGKRIQHPNGTTLTIESISFSDDYITVNFDVLNGHKKAIRLAEYLDGKTSGGRLEGVILEDDTGYEYRYLPPEENIRLLVSKQERMSGSLNFIGRLSADAKSLSLSFNPEKSEDDPDEMSPKFVLENIKIER